MDTKGRLVAGSHNRNEFILINADEVGRVSLSKLYVYVYVCIFCIVFQLDFNSVFQFVPQFWDFVLLLKEPISLVFSFLIISFFDLC